jgi:DnaK suppressor protein
MADSKTGDVPRVAARLRERREALREILRAELIATRRQQYQELAGQVHDIGDESVAELLMGVDLAGRERDLEEMREVEGALQRIRQGSFGICVDCHNPIEPDRLNADPVVKRCVLCQHRYEQIRNGGKDGSPSL